MKDEAETHRPGGGSVGDVVLPGGQRQGRLIELHEDGEQRLASAAFWGCLSFDFGCSDKKQNVMEQSTKIVSAYISMPEVLHLLNTDCVDMTLEITFFPKYPSGKHYITLFSLWYEYQ